MAQQLWFLRHGEAEPHGARPDADRELTERGRGQSDSAGRALAALDITFQLALTSPKARADQTARIACAHLDIEAHTHDALSSGFDREEAIALLRAAGEDQRVLVVGHEPDFSQTVHDLTGARIELKKGGIAAVRVDGAAAELLVLLRPRELDQIAAAARAGA
jgi:phosphohistidine phosphatase